jgi:hypothetical protein
MLLAYACSANEDVGHSRGIWAFAGGGSHDVSLCSPKRPGPPGLRCTAAPQTLRVAFATCGDLAVDRPLTIDPREEPVLLASSGSITTSAPLHVGGPMVASGAIVALDTQDVAGDLQAGAGWRTNAPVTVGGDAFVSDALEAKSSTTITGTLHVPEGSDVVNVAAKNIEYGAFTVAPPLACAAMPAVQQMVTTATTSRDPASALAIAPLALADVKQPTQVTLGCGTYLLGSIGANAALTLHVVGRTVLVIEGDLTVNAPTTIDLAAGATLDLVIGGRLDVGAALEIGSPDDPDATFVAVGSAVAIGAPTQLFGALYAPTARAAVDDELVVHGATIVGTTRISAPVVVRDGPAFAGSGCIAPR